MAFERINLVSGLLAAVVGVVGLGIAIYLTFRR